MRVAMNWSCGVWLCLLTLVAPSASAAPPAGPPDELSVLHILIVADTNANIGVSVGLDRDNMIHVLKNGVKDDKRLDLKKMDGDDVSPDRVLAYYKSLKDSVKSDEALAFFYAGHGATIDGQHTLTMKAGNLKRQDLLDAMKATNAPLIVCLTDCCATQIKGGVVVTSQDATDDNPVIHNLFFQARGVVDITAATLDASMGDDTNGGFFTRSLTRCLRDKPENLAGPNDNGFVTWAAFYEKVRQATSDVCDEYVSKERGANRTPIIEHQVPKAFSLGDNPKAFSLGDGARPIKQQDARDAFNLLMAQAKKVMPDFKMEKRDVGKGTAQVVVADGLSPDEFTKPVEFDKAQVSFGVRIWAALAGRDGKETGQCVCLPKYKWHANDYFYVYLETTAPIQVGFYQGYPENGTVVKTVQVLPDPKFPDSFGTVLPGRPFKFPTLIKMDDNPDPEFMAIVCTAAWDADSVINKPDPGATGLDLAAAQQKGMDRLLARAKDQGVKGRFVGAVPSVDPSNPGAAPTPGGIDLKPTSTNPDDVSVIQFGPKTLGFTMLKLSK